MSHGISVGAGGGSDRVDQRVFPGGGGTNGG